MEWYSSSLFSMWKESNGVTISSHGDLILSFGTSTLH